MLPTLYQFENVVDLSHTIHPDMPHWPNDPQTKIAAAAALDKEGYRLNALTIGEHSGTHIGAPSHMGGEIDVSAIEPHKLILPAMKIDVSGKAGADRDYLLTVEDIESWQRGNDVNPAGVLVLIQTGWSVKWMNESVYLGLDGKGMHFPGISKEAAAVLVQLRIAGLGIDTPGVDGGQSADFAVNSLLAQKGVYHLENLTALERLPNKDFYVFVGALKICGGSGSPCRVLAIW